MDCCCNCSCRKESLFFVACLLIRQEMLFEQHQYQGIYPSGKCVAFISASMVVIQTCIVTVALWWLKKRIVGRVDSRIKMLVNRECRYCTVVRKANIWWTTWQRQSDRALRIWTLIFFREVSTWNVHHDWQFLWRLSPMVSRDSYFVSLCLVQYKLVQVCPSKGRFRRTGRFGCFTSLIEHSFTKFMFYLLTLSIRRSATTCRRSFSKTWRHVHHSIYRIELAIL